MPPIWLGDLAAVLFLKLLRVIALIDAQPTSVDFLRIYEEEGSRDTLLSTTTHIRFFIFILSDWAYGRYYDEDLKDNVYSRFNCVCDVSSGKFAPLMAAGTYTVHINFRNRITLLTGLSLSCRSARVLVAIQLCVASVSCIRLKVRQMHTQTSLVESQSTCRPQTRDSESQKVWCLFLSVSEYAT